MVRSINLILLFSMIFILSNYGQKVPPPPPPPPPPASDKIGFQVDVPPLFVGCENGESIAIKKQCTKDKLTNFVYKNFQYVPDGSFEGHLVARFVIDVDGSMKSIEIVRDIGGGLGRELNRILTVFAAQPDMWIAAQNKGENIKYSYTFPFKYKLN